MRMISLRMQENTLIIAGSWMRKGTGWYRIQRAMDVFIQIG